MQTAFSNKESKLDPSSTSQTYDGLNFLNPNNGSNLVRNIWAHKGRLYPSNHTEGGKFIGNFQNPFSGTSKSEQEPIVCVCVGEGGMGVSLCCCDPLDTTRRKTGRYVATTGYVAHSITNEQQNISVPDYPICPYQCVYVCTSVPVSIVEIELKP